MVAKANTVATKYACTQTENALFDATVDADEPAIHFDYTRTPGVMWHLYNFFVPFLPKVWGPLKFVRSRPRTLTASIS